jgi:hypothetical protein
VGGGVPLGAALGEGLLVLMVGGGSRPTQSRSDPAMGSRPASTDQADEFR